VNIEHKTDVFRELELSLRQRYEYRDLSGGATKHRLTERIKLSYPLGSISGSKPIKAYVSDEIYIPLDTGRVSLHEFQIGFEIPTSTALSWQVFWGHEVKRTENGLDYHTNIVGIETGWKF